jgi:predicted Zn finger-like uncharacterized protein
MILACPACRTRYQVDDRAVVRPSGRTVRCANCGHSWHHLIPPPAPPREPRELSPGAVDVERLTANPTTMSPRAAITAPPSPRHRRKGGGLGFLVFLLLIGAIATGAYFGRERVIALWPQAAWLYGLVGLSSEGPSAGLDITDVTSTRNVDGLIVEGNITNRAAVSRTVPQLHIMLRDANQNEVAAKSADPPKPRLLPGETAHFVIAFMPASDAAVGVVVTFVAG